MRRTLVAGALALIATLGVPASAAADVAAVGFDGEAGTLAGVSAAVGSTVTPGAARNGAGGLEVAGTAAPAYARWNPDVVPQGRTHATAKVWLRVLSRAPGESVDLVTIQNARRIENFDLFVNGITGRLQWDLFRNDTDATDFAVEYGRWYLVEAQVEFADGEYSARVRVDGVDQGAIASAQPSTTVRAVIVGAESAKTHRQHYDDLALRVGDAPLGWAVTSTPTATITSPADGATFRRGAAVTSDFACEGPDFAVVACAGPATVDTSTLGTHEFTVTATDTAGQQTVVTHRYTVVDDPPTIDLVAPADGASFTQGEVVTPDFRCDDDVEVVSCDGPTAVDTATVGSHEFTVTAADSAGSSASVTHHYTVVDVTDPVIELRRPVDGATYGRGEVVEADFACEDEAGGSGLIACTGTRPSGAAIDTATLGEHEFTATATDGAGHSASVTHHYTVVDRTSPTVTLATPADGAAYARGALVGADFTCHDEVGGSGLRSFGSCLGPVALGAPVDTWTLGARDFTVTATDAAGNVGWATSSYEVLDNQPDNQIANAAAGRFVGDGVHNAVGRGQTREVRVGPGAAAGYLIRIQNDTGATDRFEVHGGRSDRRWAVRYRSAGQDVTRQVTAGRWDVGSLAPGASVLLRVVVRPTRFAGRGDQRLLTVSTSAEVPGAARDTVVAITRRG